MSQVRIGEPVRQQIERLQDRQPRANQGYELLIENQEPLEVQLLRAPQQSRARRNAAPARTNRVDQKPLLRIAVAQLLLGSRRCGLLMNLAAAVGVLEHPLHLVDRLLQHRTRRQLKLEQLATERRIYLLLIEL